MYILGKLFVYVVGTQCIYINMYVRLYVFIAIVKNTQFHINFLHIKYFYEFIVYAFMYILL